LNKRDIAALKKKLLAEREQLEKQLKDLEEQGLRTSQTDETGDVGFDEDYAGSGTVTFEREKDLSIHNNILDLLSKISAALEKIENGTYGICDNCKRSIMDARLKALPYATLCIDCKQKEEKMGR
jgi:RNA polymerase-binding protein DksA